MQPTEGAKVEIYDLGSGAMSITLSAFAAVESEYTSQGTQVFSFVSPPDPIFSISGSSVIVNTSNIAKINTYNFQI